MKKVLLVALMGLGAVHLNAENLSDKQFKQLLDDCVNNENVSSCQRLIDSGVMASIEQCDKENCNNIGRVYKRTENYRQAFKYYKKACELNDKWGCGGLATLYDQGLGVKQNFAETFKFAKKACDLNNTPACFNLGLMYAEGQGVRQDFVNARKYYEKACDANVAEACSNLGTLHYNGQGVRQDYSTAKKYFGKACDLGYQMGCNNYRILNEQGVK